MVSPVINKRAADLTSIYLQVTRAAGGKGTCSQQIPQTSSSTDQRMFKQHKPHKPHQPQRTAEMEPILPVWNCQRCQQMIPTPDSYHRCPATVMEDARRPRSDIQRDLNRLQHMVEMINMGFNPVVQQQDIQLQQRQIEREDTFSDRIRVKVIPTRRRREAVTDDLDEGYNSEKGQYSEQTNGTTDTTYSGLDGVTNGDTKITY